METAASVMRDPITVARDTPLDTLARRLRTHGIRHLPVVDHAGRLVCMVTDQEVFELGGFLLDDWVPFEEASATLTAETLGTADTPQVAPDTPLATVLRLLAGPADCVVVAAEDGHVRGLLTEHDAVRVGAAVIPADLPIDLETTGEVIAVRRETSARVALDRMLQERVRHVVIEEEERPVGVLSFRDLVIDGVPDGRALTAWEVVRSTQVHTAPLGTTLQAAAQRLADLAIGCLPIVDANGTLAGMVTRTDIARAAAVALEDESLFGED